MQSTRRSWLAYNMSAAFYIKNGRRTWTASPWADFMHVTRAKSARAVPPCSPWPAGRVSCPMYCLILIPTTNTTSTAKNNVNLYVDTNLTTSLPRWLLVEITSKSRSRTCPQELVWISPYQPCSIKWSEITWVSWLAGSPRLPPRTGG